MWRLTWWWRRRGRGSWGRGPAWRRRTPPRWCRSPAPASPPGSVARFTSLQSLQKFTKFTRFTPYLLVCPDQRQQGEQDQARQPRHVERPPSLQSPVTVCNPESRTIMTLIISPSLLEQSRALLLTNTELIRRDPFLGAHTFTTPWGKATRVASEDTITTRLRAEGWLKYLIINANLCWIVDSLSSHLV